MSSGVMPFSYCTTIRSRLMRLLPIRTMPPSSARRGTLSVSRITIWSPPLAINAKLVGPALNLLHAKSTRPAQEAMAICRFQQSNTTQYLGPSPDQVSETDQCRQTQSNARNDDRPIVIGCECYKGTSHCTEHGSRTDQ